MDIPLGVQDTGRCSPINGNAESSKNLVNFGFTQEQVECVCEVKKYLPMAVLNRKITIFFFF